MKLKTKLLYLLKYLNYIRSVSLICNLDYYSYIPLLLLLLYLEQQSIEFYLFNFHY